ncbi:amidohydrolase family protein [Mycobacterium szulgai]|uniref:2-pyrone-4,6-dicarboxylate hydrolase n=1 Tax=Mycobacterium szulgai TaxID=1787 RepID=A0A1X2EQ75_MYCSZ|nr:amidohydrolase family protein [Mycobacterium szulgai]MCV7079165.1 amidohydrolase family protein [Mycobacterium szulgai]ORX08283.1 2-pyrone-4,6-dicarboxylate hydrolase [Mycobacterium szulgai]
MSFDAHFHIIDPAHPLIPNEGYVPQPFTVADYLRQAAPYDITGGAVVSGSFQGFDQGYLVDALRQLGPGWVGVTQLDPAASDEYIVELDRAGVRAVRFTLARGGALDVDLAMRVHDVAGWHTELYVDAAQLPELTPQLSKLPRVSVDHLGLSHPGLPHLLDAVDRGIRVKATGFGRLKLDIADALRRVDAVNPHALLFGTDLPGTRAPRAFTMADLNLITDTLGDTALQRLSENARSWYRQE